MSQDQIVTLYQSSKSNISEHIKHILEEGELDQNSVVRNFRITANDGKLYKGEDGKNGANGRDGEDGVSITNSYIVSSQSVLHNIS